MNPHKVELQIDSTGKGSVKLDGVELGGCLGVKVHARPGKVSVVRLLLRAKVSGEFEVHERALSTAAA